ncbi:hypothetical protein ACP4OV_000823 [Aristida adscensionis]
MMSVVFLGEKPSFVLHLHCTAPHGALELLFERAVEQPRCVVLVAAELKR